MEDKIEKWKVSKGKTGSCRQSHWLSENKFISITGCDKIVTVDVNSPILGSIISNEKDTKNMTSLCPVDENMVLIGHDNNTGFK